MCADNKSKSPSLVWSVFTNRCPRCRKGKLFVDPNPYNLKITMRMHDFCPVCGQKFELQTGFYFGTGYVSYGLSVALLAMTFVAWKLLLGMSVSDNSVFWWLGFSTALLVILQPVLQRWSRSIWIAFFVRYDAEWRVHNRV